MWDTAVTVRYHYTCMSCKVNLKTTPKMVMRWAQEHEDSCRLKGHHRIPMRAMVITRDLRAGGADENTEMIYSAVDRPWDDTRMTKENWVEIPDAMLDTPIGEFALHGYPPFNPFHGEYWVIGQLSKSSERPRTFC